MGLDAPSMGKPKPDETGQKHIRVERLGIAYELNMKGKLIAMGYHVSTPSLNTSYDFITEYEGVFNTVQMRTTNYCTSHGFYRIKATKGYSVLLAHVIPTDTTYVIPFDQFNRAWINVHKTRPSKYDEFKENWNLLKKAH